MRDKIHLLMRTRVRRNGRACGVHTAHEVPEAEFVLGAEKDSEVWSYWRIGPHRLHWLSRT